MVSLAVLGALCVAVVNIDLLWTVVAAGAGGGPVTSRLASLMWNVAPRGTGSRHHRVLEVMGVVITVAILAIWIGVLLLGWFLLFSAAPEAVVSASSGDPADVWARLYFTGFTVFTLGTGDYVPGAPFWQLATVVATASGLVLVTLAITYVLSITTSVTQRRQLASQISALGTSPIEILRRSWNGSDLQGLEQALQSLTSGLADLAQRHLAFPVLHYFHSPERNTAIAPSVAVLDELLTILQHGVAPGDRLPTLTTTQVRDAVSELLHRATGVGATRPRSPTSMSPPGTGLDPVRRLGIPVVEDDKWRARLEDLESRRETLGEFLFTDGWQWEAVWPPPARR